MDGKLNSYYFFVILFILFFSLVGLPIIYTYFSAFFTNNIDAFESTLNVDNFWLLGKSILLAFSIAVFSTFIGGILSFLLYKTNLKFINAFKLILLIPLFISPQILVVAWKNFFFFAFGATSVLTSYFGVFFILSFIFTPLAMIIIGSALSNINSSIEESGLMVVSIKKVIIKILIPLIKPSILTSFVLIFIFSISEFSVPAFLGVKVFTTEIFIQFSAFYNHEIAIMQSFWLVILCVILLLIERKQLLNYFFFSIGNKGSHIKRYKINHFLGFFILIFWGVISVALPLLVLSFQTFKDGIGQFVKAFYLLLPTFSHSIFLATVTSLVMVVLGLITALNLNKSPKLTRLFLVFLLLGFAIPSIVFGISFIKFYNKPMLDFIYSSSLILMIAYIGKFSFIAVKILSHSINQIPKSFDEVALLMGLSPFKRFTKIILPIIFPTIFVTFIIGFIFTIGDLGMSIMLYPPGTELLSIKVFTIMANVPQSLSSAMALIVFLLTLLLLIVFYYVMRIFKSKLNQI